MTCTIKFVNLTLTAPFQKILAAEEVRGSVEPSLMAHWKARVEFLLSVIEVLFLSLTVEALQGEMCQLAAIRRR